MRKLPLLMLVASAFAVPAPADAQLLTLGAGGGGFGGGYVPSAVSFNQTASLSTKGFAAGVTDTPRGFVVAWFRGSVGNLTFQGQNADSSWSAGLADLLGNYASAGSSETAPGMILVWDNLSSTIGTARLNINDSNCNTSCGTNANHSYQAYRTNTWVNTSWHQYIWIWDMSFAQGSRRSALYIDGIKQTLTSAAEVGTIVNPFNININNAAGYGFNVVTQSGAPGSFDIADVMVDTHTTGLIDASNNFTGSITKLYNNGPVSLGPQCASPLGSVPEFCFVGDKTSFATNQGAATQAFALSNPVSGTSSATPLLYNASYGPAGAPSARPVFQWVYSSHLTGQNAATTSYPLTTHGNLANKISLGDLLIDIVQLEDTSVSLNRAMTIAAPSGTWNVLSTTGISFPYVSPTLLPSNYAIYWKLADASDVTAAGGDWTNAPTISWTANANALRTASQTVVDYINVNQTTPIQAAAAQYNTTSTTPQLPAVTPTSTPATLISVVQLPSNDGVDTPPTGEDLRYRRTDAAGGSQSFALVSDAAAAGAISARNAAISATRATLTTSIIIGK